MPDPGEWCDRHGRVHGDLEIPSDQDEEWWPLWDGGNGGQAPRLRFRSRTGAWYDGEPPYIKLRTPTEDELSRLRGMAETAMKLQKNLMVHGFADTPPQVHIDLSPPPQKHRPLIPGWLPLLFLALALMVAGFSELREAPLALALLVFAGILLPGAREGLKDKHEDRTERYWREVAALEMDIYGEYVSSETMRRFGGGLPE